MRKDPHTRPRHLVSVFASIAWFHEIRLHLGASSVAEVAHAIEPRRSRTVEEIKTLERRWRDYRAGLHSPGYNSINQAALICRSSRIIIDSALWNALRLDRCPRQSALALIGRTNKAGDELITLMLSPHEDHCNPHPLWIRNHCRDLIKHGTLDSLATITICMRLAVNASALKLAETLAYWISWNLRCLCIWLFEHGILYPMAEYYEIYVFSKCSGQHSWFSFNAAHFLASVRQFALVTEDKAATLGRKLTIIEIAEMVLKTEAM